MFEADGTFLAKWGSSGTGDGQFLDAGAVVEDITGNVHISDVLRVQIFDTDGNFLLDWGTFGTGDGQVNHPSGMVVDVAGNLFMVDHNNHRIQKFK